MMRRTTALISCDKLPWTQTACTFRHQDQWKVEVLTTTISQDAPIVFDGGLKLSDLAHGQEMRQLVSWIGKADHTFSDNCATSGWSAFWHKTDLQWVARDIFKMDIQRKICVEEYGDPFIDGIIIGHKVNDGWKISAFGLQKYTLPCSSGGQWLLAVSMFWPVIQLLTHLEQAVICVLLIGFILMQDFVSCCQLNSGCLIFDHQGYHLLVLQKQEWIMNYHVSSRPSFHAGVLRHLVSKLTVRVVCCGLCQWSRIAGLQIPKCTHVQCTTRKNWHQFSWF